MLFIILRTLGPPPPGPPPPPPPPPRSSSRRGSGNFFGSLSAKGLVLVPPPSPPPQESRALAIKGTIATPAPPVSAPTKAQGPYFFITSVPAKPCHRVFIPAAKLPQKPLGAVLDAFNAAVASRRFTLRGLSLKGFASDNTICISGI